MEPGRLTKLLRGELDWVVMKCLEKQRDRRYETANGLARDVQRYLADEAVEARPPSAGYRLRKFVKRNKGRVFAAAVVFLALIGGIIGTSFGLIRAEEEKRRAVDAEAVAVKSAASEKDAKLAALDEQQKAEKARDQEEKAKAAAVAAAEAEKAARVRALEEQKKAEKARDTTAEQRKLALDTVRDVLLRVDDLMKNDAKLAPLRVEIIRRMLDDVDRIRDHAVKNPLEDRTAPPALTGNTVATLTSFTEINLSSPALTSVRLSARNVIARTGAALDRSANREWPCLLQRTWFGAQLLPLGLRLGPGHKVLADLISTFLDVGVDHLFAGEHFGFLRRLSGYSRDRYQE